MPIKYYPSNRIKTDLYTRGEDYVLPDGTAYRGAFYITYTGRAYAGANPVIGTNEELTRVTFDKEELYSNFGGEINASNQRYSLIQSKQVSPGQVELNSGVLQELLPYYPFPLEEDYQRGYFTRFFAKTVSGPGYIIEISQQDFAYLSNGFISPTTLGYEFTKMLWQLTGPLNDQRVSQYQIKGGVLTTNKRVTEAKDITFRGLVAFIGGDYTKFARISE